MKYPVTLSKRVRWLGLLACLAVAFAARAEDLQEGATVEISGRKAVVKKLQTLPFVESDYTKRFRFDSWENPKLRELRERYKLDEVVAAGRDEFERQVLLMDWTHRQFKKFGHPSSNAKGALEILRDIGEGQTFFCS